MRDNTLGHMIARFRVKTGYKPSAREVMAMAKAEKFLAAEAAKEEQK